MLGMLIDAHTAGRLQFFGDYQHLADARAFRAYLGPLWTTDWFVYAKRPFAGPEQVLAYLSRYTHRVAISNSRLVSADASGVTFTLQGLPDRGPRAVQDHDTGAGRVHSPLPHARPAQGLPPHPPLRPTREWHWHPRREPRPRSRAHRCGGPSQCAAAATRDGTCQDTTLSEQLDHPCPHCGSRMQIIETFEPGHRPRHRPSEPVVVIGMNTS
jgi:Putative transposase